MDLTGVSATFREHVAPRVLAPAAELLLDALPDVAPEQRWLEVSAGLGTLTHALVDRLRSSTPHARALVVAAREDLAPLAGAPPFVRFVRAGAERLPFADGSFDVVVGNVPLGLRAYDGARLAAVRRALRPGGTVVLTALLSGSFEEVLDVLLEVSEHTADARLRAAVTDARREPYDEAALRGLLEEEGFTVEAFGVEERGLLYASGQAAASDPLLLEALVEGFLGARADERLRREVGRFVDTYFEGRGFAVRVCTGVVRARLAR